MKKKIGILLASVAMVLSLAACGGNGNADNSQKTAQSTEQGATTQDNSSKTDTKDNGAGEDNQGATSQDSQATGSELKVLALKGPTAMGMAGLVKDSEENAKNGLDVKLNVTGAIDEVPPAIIKGEADIAAIPANMASVLYNKTQGQIDVLAINTLGVLYILDNGGNVKSIKDLAGKTVYASGKGATPEYVLNYILDKNGLKDKVKVEWKSEHTEALADLMKNKDSLAMLPQPFATVATVKNPNIKSVIDLNKEWKEIQTKENNPSDLVTGVVIAKKDFVEQHKDQVNKFLEDYKKSVEFVNSDNEGASKIIGDLGIVPAPVAQKAIPFCNIVFINNEDMQKQLDTYLNVLFKENPKSIGGQLPKEDFYYINK